MTVPNITAHLVLLGDYLSGLDHCNKLQLTFDILLRFKLIIALWNGMVWTGQNLYSGYSKILAEAEHGTNNTHNDDERKLTL